MVRVFLSQIMSNDQNTAIKENLYEKYEIVQVNDADSSFNKWYQIRDENNNVANDYAFGGFAQGDSGGGLRGVSGKGTSASGNRQVDVSNAAGSAIDVAQVQVIAQGELA